MIQRYETNNPAPGRVMRGAVPIIDLDILRHIKGLPFSSFFCDTNDKSMDTGILPEYLNFLPQWIASSRLNSVEGLERFPLRRLTSGNTQAFDDFYIRHHERTFKFLRGEYPYLSMYARRWDLVNEPAELTRKDALVMSAPFSATGNMHPLFYDMLERADQVGIPVLIDCAFLGITRNLKLQLEHRCIETVCFSLSKAFGAGCFRSGIELSKQNGGPASIQNEWCYVQLLSAKIGLEIARQYSPDYIPEKYRAWQLEICQEFGLEPSDTVVFGLGDERFGYFDVDGVVNRVCITPSIKSRIDVQEAARRSAPAESAS
jgi:hypothetical protein